MINVATATFLALDLSDSDSLFVERGDGETYGIVSQFHRRAERISQQHSGAIVKVMDTEVLFAFESPSQALRALLELAGSQEDDEHALRFSAALHHGTTLATANNGFLDYFGGTVHLVQRLLRLAGAEELLMSEQVAADSAVVAEILDRGLHSEVCDFPQLGQFGLRCQRLRVGKEMPSQPSS